MEKFLARQPILDSERIVYGYEVLSRSGPENYFSHSQPDLACVSATDNLFLIGIERLTQGRRAFINCTRDFIVREYLDLLPKDNIVIEVLETVSPDEKVLAACRRMKEAGYLIALDDFRDGPQWRPLVALADFIKVDILATEPAEQRRLAQQFARTSVRLIAEKVETYEDFQRTLDWGYAYFQGYFFSRPQMLSHHDIPSSKLHYLRILRYLNSPLFFLAAEVRSIPHALRLLGHRGVRKWVSLVAVACMGDGKPEELVVLPLIRARFCELMAPKAGLATVSNDLFLLGLFSAMDAMLDMKMEDVLREVAIAQEIRDALLGKKNSLRDVFEIAVLYEMGSWEAIDEAAARLRVGEDVIPSVFLNSVEWARRLMNGEQEEETEIESS